MVKTQGSPGVWKSGGLIVQVCVLGVPSCCGARGNLEGPVVPPISLSCYLGNFFSSGDFSLSAVLNSDLKNDF